MPEITPSTTGFLSARDRTPLFWRSWSPDGAHRATILFVHGGAEHGGRYPALISTLLANKFAVLAPDLRGHGRSGGRRGALRRFSDYLDDLDTVVEFARRDEPGRVFVAGYSLGGLISAMHLSVRWHGEPPAGLVLLAPALAPGVAAPRAIFTVVKALSSVAPWLPVFKMPATSMASDPAVRDAYSVDPLVHHGFITARMLGEFTIAMKSIPDRIGGLRSPLLVVHGENDVTAHPGRSRDLVDRLGGSDATLLTYPAMRHDLCNEPNNAAVMDDIAHWIGARCEDLHRNHNGHVTPTAR